MKATAKIFLRWLAWLGIALLALQVFFIARIALTAWVNPEATSFQRSEAWRIANAQGSLPWRQEWVGYAGISDNIKRAVIASEDSDFAFHNGVEWEAIEKAWQKNATQAQKSKRVKIVGGSTISQQLAKNLLLSGERNLVRKGQEFVLTLALELLLDKQRILEIYLNNVEWGEGVFGAEAAAQHYFHKSAARLNPYEAARLAVMLPRPKYFEKLPNSAYVSNRAYTIMARMGDADLP